MYEHFFLPDFSVCKGCNLPSSLPPDIQICLSALTSEGAEIWGFEEIVCSTLMKYIFVNGLYGNLRECENVWE